jgi:tRNA-modifying protein YgfZ
MLPHVAQRFVRAGVALAGVQAYEAMRVEAVRPRVGRDTDRCTLPGEVGWLGVAARLDRRCYPGQVALARAEEQGGVRRRLVRLRLSVPAEDLPEHRAPVLLDGRRVGFVGTVVPHHVLGPVALALVDAGVPRSAVLTVGGRQAVVDRAACGPRA